MKRVVAAAAVTVGMGIGAGNAQAIETAGFVGTWESPTVAPAGSGKLEFPLGATVSVPEPFVATTLRQHVHPHIGGSAVRIRLSNEFGAAPITFENTHIGIGGEDASVKAGTNKPLLFGGKTSVTLQPGERRYSDPLEMTVKAFEDLQVSFYFADLVTSATQHSLANQAFFQAAGDHAAQESGAGFVPGGVSTFFLSDVEVLPEEPSGSIVFLGDSVTDGFLYTAPNENKRYPDWLAVRMQSDPAYKNLSVLNAGISGNRVTANNIGPSGVNRLDRDALSLPNVRAVVLQMGINDLANAPFIATSNLVPATPEEIIAGMKTIADRVHAAGKKFYAATITPVGDLTAPAGPPFETYSLPAVNEGRHKINEWIRTSGVADGVIDFAKVLEDPANQDHTNGAYLGVDGVHPSDAGYKAMADAIPLSMFKGLVPGGAAPRAANAAYACTATVASKPLANALRSGLRTTMSCTLPSTLAATMSVSSATAKQLGLGARTVAVGRATKLKGKRAFTVRFGSAARKRLAKAKGAVRMTLRVSATNGTRKLSLTKQATVRR